MERGIYFDAWFRDQYCYHPSLPIRSMQMLEDLELYHGTVLVWAGMGGGSISLPYLEHEAFGPVDPRMQIYGFMNDSEFVAECNKRGIKLFGIVFEVQGWEYPAVFDDEGHLVKMNLRAEEDENAGWYGLREFSADSRPDAFPTSLKDYYPDGIRDEEGRLVTDLWEECCTRDRFGEPIHAQWVEVKDHRETCYQMCRNNPVWRGYLKKIIELQIDAGVPGIQLDECELPMTSINSGGCFCRSCMKQFNSRLKERKKEGRLGSEWDGIDLDSFHYGEYLKAHGCSYPENAPFFRDYWEFQVWQVRRYFSELADHARAYALEKYGRKLLVSGNFYNMQPAYYPIENKVDIVITEMEHTLFRQPYYYRYCAGFARGKTVIIAENPYGGIVPELLGRLDRGRGYDLYRIYLLEASVYGCNMSVPYGSWMGNTIKDAFWAPKWLTAQIQDFLYEHDECFPRSASKGAAVLYSYGSYYWRDSNKGSGANGMQDAYESLLDVTASEWLDPDLKPVPFWDVIRALSERNAQYDVVMLPDGELREDDFSAECIRDYPLIVVPDCHVLTEKQQNILLEYARGGGRLLVAGRIADGTSLREELEKIGNAVFVPAEGAKEAYMPGFMKAFAEMYDGIAPVLCDCADVGVARYDKDGTAYIHLLNYRYDEAADRVQTIAQLELTVRDASDREACVLAPEGIEPAGMEISKKGDDLQIRLTDLGLYAVICLK
ncbi:MAG: hypothetical protein K6E50_13590 [Lachnospiraceae bacterium]|nr:hypothetical protein [Lachnospiraceae bacterium]